MSSFKLYNGVVFIHFSIDFTGDFTRAQVNLEENGLTAFREGVFKDMLTQMVIQPPSIGGQLIVTGSESNF